MTSQNYTIEYGFAPDPDHQGWPVAPGMKYENDNLAYDFNQSKGDYKASFEINNNQLQDLKEFGNNPFDKYKFDSTYNGLKNSCIDFAWKALEIAGFNPSGFPGDLIPTWNIDDLENAMSKLRSDQIYDELFNEYDLENDLYDLLDSDLDDLFLIDLSITEGHQTTNAQVAKEDDVIDDYSKYTFSFAQHLATETNI